MTAGTPPRGFALVSLCLKAAMSRLVRSICAALCVAGALLGGGGANAQSVVLYGLMDVSAAQIKPVGGEAVELLETGGLQRSFLGFRGAEDLGGGLRAVFKLESYFGVDNGDRGRDGNDVLGPRVERRPVGSVRHDRPRPHRDAAVPDDDELQSVRRIVRLLAEHAPVFRARRDARRHAAGTTRSTTSTTRETRCA